MQSLTQNPELSWIKEAKAHLGLKEVVGAKHNPTIQQWLRELGAWWDDDENAWCGVYVAHCLKSNNLAIPKNWFRAKEYSDFGLKLDKPAYGCIAVKSRKGGVHVCFVIGRNKRNNKLICIGGNQNNAVTLSQYPESDFESFIWPSIKPSDLRYRLPLVDMMNSVVVSES